MWGRNLRKLLGELVCGFWFTYFFVGTLAAANNLGTREGQLTVVMQEGYNLPLPGIFGGYWYCNLFRYTLRRNLVLTLL